MKDKMKMASQSRKITEAIANSSDLAGVCRFCRCVKVVSVVH
ncbi:hypothetical protein HMPREF3214_00360 [Alloscardovia omnicolens]|nr:hypothetical protein HMPREF3214_00360 [Alloscardovia omnicolens]